MNSTDNFNPAENSGYGAYTQDIEAPRTTEAYQAPEQPVYGGYEYQPNPDVTTYGGYAPAPKKRRKGNSTVMLLMSFITFVCMVMCPLVKLQTEILPIKIPLYATDVARLTTMNTNIVGDTVDSIANSFDKRITVATRTENSNLGKSGTETMRGIVGDEFQVFGSQVEKGLSAIKTVLITAVAIVAGIWAIIIITALRGMRKLYSLFNLVMAGLLACVMIAVSVISRLGAALDYGIIATFVMLLASVLIAGVSKSKE